MTELTESQQAALRIAHALVDAGVPVFVAARNHGPGPEFHLPRAWQETVPSHEAVDRWRPGWAMCAVMGVVCDALDTDPRHGGDASRTDLIMAGVWPRVYGVATTPSGGTHEIISRTHLAKGKPAAGIDLQAGDDKGEGRGFLFIAPTVRLAKAGPREGHAVEYTWTTEPDMAWLTDYVEGDGTTEQLVYLLQNTRSRKTPTTKRTRGEVPEADDDDPFDTVYSAWTPDSAQKVVDGQLQAVEAARDGAVNSTLGGAARLMGRFVGALFTEAEAADMLLAALERGGVHSDKWNVANGKNWTAATVIQAGLANGMEEPWDVMEVPEPEPAAAPEPGIKPAPVGASVPGLCVGSAAEMTYWLQSQMGSGSLSGFFLRGGHVVHTPRVNELGYVAPRDAAEENGPAQIQDVSPGQLTAKIQYAHRCYKVVDVKDPETGKRTGEKTEIPALFPLEAAKRAIDAAEALPMLRSLSGVTLTPMVRTDGSILDVPGYDPESSYLFLPGPGVRVAPVPEAPTDADLAKARGLLDEMVAGFPWETKDDKANYYGMLLTPLLRLLAPPSYKGFFIGAHQPGSGKTLLADIARILHGGILRSEMPTDEPEIKKMTTSLLATTSAPVVHVDNVTGVLRSSTIAGLLTADGELQERELGSSRNLTFTNDRVWVFTGNNPSLGGDMVRRTITIMIDPNMANPETRSFAIQDLPAWVHAHRNELLHALMTMIRYWVAAGSRPAERQQSDSFATWEACVDGILQACSIPGRFDQESGKRAARGGDDDGLAALLEHIWEGHEGRPWTVSELLTAEPEEWRASALEWLPTAVLDKLARSEAGGRKSLGRWLLNRVGRWVTIEGGTSLVLREAGQAPRSKVSMWKVETRS